MSKPHMYRFDDFLVDPETWRLCRQGHEVHLEPIVLKLLLYLITNRDRLVTRQELMDTVWGDTVVSDSALSKAVARLRQALDDDSASPRYLETVHSQGYRFVAEVEETERPDRPDLPDIKHREAAARRKLLIAFWVLAPRHDTAPTDGIRSIAVLPLSNLTGDPEHGYYADGLQDILITELSQIGELRVTSRQSTKRYRDSQLSTTDIAAELGVDALVEGSLLSAGSNVELTIQLINSRTDEHIWAKRYARETAYVLELIADMAEAIGAELISTPAMQGSQPLADKQTGPVDPRAIDAYSLGLTHLDRFTVDGIRFAIDQFQKAVTIEPDFALAWGHLAVAHAMHALYGYAPPRESIEKARAAALKAIESDDRFYIGYSTLGWVRLWTGDLNGACDSFDYALQLNRSAPYALHGDADCLMLEGRMDESIARTRELQMVGPFSGMHNRPLPYHLFLARRYEESFNAAMAMQTRISGFSMHWFLAQVYWKQGLFDEALEEERQELEWRNDDVMLAALEEGLEAAGPVGAMHAMAETLASRAIESYVDPFKIAEAYVRAGSVDEAFYWLDKAVDHGSYEITYLAFQPDFDVLRNDARYQELLERVYGSRATQFTPRR